MCRKDNVDPVTDGICTASPYQSPFFTFVQVETRCFNCTSGVSCSDLNHQCRISQILKDENKTEEVKHVDWVDNIGNFGSVCCLLCLFVRVQLYPDERFFRLLPFHTLKRLRQRLQPRWNGHLTLWNPQR